MGELTTLYRISEAGLRLRRDFIGLTQPEVKILAGLLPWANSNADKIAAEFYDYQFSFGPTRAFFEEFARERHMSIDQLRQHVQGAQARYFREIFQEAAGAGQFGTEYFEKRLGVGRLHNVINLPFKWYAGSYTRYFAYVRSHLNKSFPMRARFRADAEQAILTVFNLDMQAVTDAFFYDYLQSIGLDLSAIRVDRSEHDLSEHYADLKEVVKETLVETARASRMLARVSADMSAAADQTKDAVSQVAQAVVSVATGAQEASRSAETTNDAMRQLTQAIDSIASGATEQARQVQSVSATAVEMATSVQQVATTADTVAQASKQSKDAAATGAKAVRETVAGMAEIRDVVSEAAQKVVELGLLGEKIGAVVETIDDIAEQTNLLALNAAIEAARAGEHGMGFAVVADEVRKLAERSQRETKSIGDLIKEVQTGTQVAVQAMKNGSAKVEEGSKRADQAGAALAEILDAVESTVTQVSQIADGARKLAGASDTVVKSMNDISLVVEQNTAATEEMAAQSNQVLDTVRSIASVATEQSASTEEVSASAEEMSAQIEQVSVQAGQLSTTAAQLQTLVGRFKLGTENETDDMVAPPRLSVVR